MGLKETIAAGIASGFQALGNVIETVSYLVYSATSSYSPTTGLVTRVESTLTVGGIFYDYSKREIDGIQVKPHDQKFICQQASLSVAPTLQDRLTRTDGKSWEVLQVSQDPAHATWILHVRGTNG